MSKNKIDYVHKIRLGFRTAYKATVLVQWSLWKLGINWHNVFFDECTPDFSCCTHTEKLNRERGITE